MCYTNFGDTTAWRASSCSACRTSPVNSRHLSEPRSKREGCRSRSSVSIAPHASCTINSLEKPNGHKSWKEVLLTLNLQQDSHVHSDSPQTTLIQKNSLKNSSSRVSLRKSLGEGVASSSDHMTFTERVKNLLVGISEDLLC